MPSELYRGDGTKLKKFSLPHPPFNLKVAAGKSPMASAVISPQVSFLEKSLILIVTLCGVLNQEGRAINNNKKACWLRKQKNKPDAMRRQAQLLQAASPNSLSLGSYRRNFPWHGSGVVSGSPLPLCKLAPGSAPCPVVGRI